MRNRFLLLGLFFTLISNFSYGQIIRGKITSKEDGKPLPYANVILLQDGSAKRGGLTGDDGTYVIGPVEPGSYDVKVAYLGYNDVVYPGYKFSPEKDIILNVAMEPKGEGALVLTTVIKATPPVLNSDETSQIKGFDRKQVLNFGGGRGLNSMVQQAQGVTITNGAVQIKGARSSGTQYIVDGIRVGTNAPNLPRGAIEDFSVITGGLPAEYGDLTGGVVSITTRGPSKTYYGGGEFVTSQFLDPFGYYLGEANLSGPLALKKHGKDSGDALLGFFVAGNILRAKVWDPPAIDMYKVKDDVLEDIKSDPIVKSPLGSGYVPRTFFVTKDQMEKTRVRPNTEGLQYSLNGRLQFQPVKNIDISIGGTFDRTDRAGYIYTYNMFNFDNNPQVINQTARTFVRLRQFFNTSSDSTAIIKNAYYSIQADYINSSSTVQDRNHKDNYFAYGYLGKFDRNFTPEYAYVQDTVNGKIVTSNYLQGYRENGVTYTPADVNPVLANYTKSYFDNVGDVESFSSLQAGGGLLNGQTPLSSYSLWTSPGTPYGSYSKTRGEQYFVNAQFAADVKSHSLKVGLQYQQNINRSYTVGVGSYGTSSTSLWTIARQLTNKHLTQLDKTQPMPVYSDGNFTDTINYPYQIISGNQSAFDRNFRDYLIAQGARDANGRLIDEQSLINIDAYTPEDLKLSFFSADDLLNNGNSYVSYYGYDYLGNKQKGRPSLDEFLDPKKRSIGAYNPIYTAGYIQDKFILRDLIFRVGLRVDRFDANQLVLKDPYSLYPVKTAGQVSAINNKPVSHPGNIGEDYTVYVDDALNPTKVVGYRSNDRWYDATGAEVQDPNLIALATNSGRIQPYLEARSEDEVKLTSNSFKDYEPQVNLLPRVSFSFPISQRANFFANYDVLTQRPATANFATPDDYFYLQNRATLAIENPNLKPEKRTNYEIGFKQAIGDVSAISVQAYYGQIRDLIQRVRVNQAYPISYTTYGNIDFGTVKGFTFGYDMFRDNSSGVQLSANYTLQFADGTGSSASSGAGIINAGQPNLRTPFPLSYDVRHQINTILDFRFGNEADYRGPVLGNGTKLLKNAGINFVLNARSGTPYTRQRNVTIGNGNDVMIGVAQRSAITGTINGSRLPWQFRADMRVDKDFYFVSRKKTQAAGGETRYGKTSLNIYLLVQNLLDARNIVSVYNYTGLPDDDGYLASDQVQQDLGLAVFQQAFLDQYSIKVNNPDNYISPRFIRLGAMINF